MNQQKNNLKEYLKEKQRELFDNQKKAIENLDMSQGYYAYQLSNISNLDTKPSFSFLMKIIEGWGLNFLDVMKKAGFISDDILKDYFKNNSSILENQDNIIDIYIFHGNKINSLDDLPIVGSYFFETNYKDCCGIKNYDEDYIHAKNELLIIQRKFNINNINNKNICVFYNKNENKIEYFIASCNQSNDKITFIHKKKLFNFELGTPEFDQYTILGVIKHIVIDANGDS